MSRFKLKFLLATLSVVAANTATATTVITGSVGEFGGQADLLLNPATNVIAVDVFGNGNSVVNGVTFFTDGSTVGGGSATNGGVTVTTTAANQIDNWAAAPAFTGADAGALGEIMRDIRWEAAPSPIGISVSGLATGSTYDLQLLFNEGADRSRHWDIGVDGALVVDNMTSEGIDGVGVWSPNNSFFYRGQFVSSDGTLSIQLAADLGGDAPTGLDNNPILAGIVIHQVIPEPGTSMLLGLGALSLLARRRRRQ